LRGWDGAYDLLDFSRSGAFELWLSDEILEEAADVLLTHGGDTPDVFVLTCPGKTPPD
jgi:hypothetical protein